MIPPRRIPPSLSRDPGAPPPPADLPDDAPEPIEPAPDAGRRRRPVLRALLLTLALLVLAPLAVVLALRWVPPPTSAFMLQSATQPVQYRWVPAARLPEALRRAVIAAEDQKFPTHWGFDLVAIAEALEHNEKSRRVRGASTITQQTAKNLFLWPSRSYLRKGLEAGLTLLLELAWPKERILEVYLNIAEFGPGIYGAEAAARAFFGKPAERLSPVEAALLAAVLPNPRRYQADQPGPYVQRRTDWILAAMGHAPRFAAAPEVEPLEDPAALELDAEAPADAGAFSPPPEATVQTQPLDGTAPPGGAVAPEAPGGDAQAGSDTTTAPAPHTEPATPDPSEGEREPDPALQSEPEPAPESPSP